MFRRVRGNLLEICVGIRLQVSNGFVLARALYSLFPIYIQRNYVLTFFAFDFQISKLNMETRTYSALLNENVALKARVAELEEKLAKYEKNAEAASPSTTPTTTDHKSTVQIDSAVSAPPRLSHEQIERYSRQLILHDVGVKAQKRICNASVLVVGAGGLGAPVSLYLAGLLCFSIFLFDEKSCLQRLALVDWASSTVMWWSSTTCIDKSSTRSALSALQRRSRRGTRVCA